MYGRDYRLYHLQLLYNCNPEENRIDSPYYQPLSPTSGGDETGITGEAVQTAGGGNKQQQRVAATTATAGGSSKQQAVNKQQQQVAAGGGGGATAGGSTINILEGSSIQGSPDYDPDELTASAGAEVTVVNQDSSALCYIWNWSSRSRVCTAV